MRKFLLLLILTSCISKVTYKQVFETPENSALIDSNKIKTIDDFEVAYCSHFDSTHSKPLMLPFDFIKGEIATTSKYSIPLYGNPMNCSSFDIHRNHLVIIIESTGNWKLDSGAKIDRSQIDSLVNMNIFNFGYYPELSDDPEDAIFRIELIPNESMGTLNTLLYEISKSYLNIINEEMGKRIKDSIPLNIILDTHIELPTPVLDSVYDEIEKDIEIDLSNGGI
ncbi:hypothetical protein [Algoriphagus machipongonensis]|uniref:Uncharacterized protein n=1 Tax=Algoriphagus machipongonensis TaxID=388413 RepID=A3HWU5_9BACT|nr:hypothetical protein [Algoriphagus machipongonensis]EAZ81068.1 hypothetical protein ALPR1_18568 [Algoriphagus machipongonensis]